MDVIPEDDEWFCPDCKNEDDIVKAGQKQEDGKKKKNMASKKNPECTRDWGKGFATVGRTKECKIVPSVSRLNLKAILLLNIAFFRITLAPFPVSRSGSAGTLGSGCPRLVSTVLTWLG